MVRVRRILSIGYVLLVMAGCVLTACNRNTIYSHYESTSLEGWERSDTLFFEDIVVKATADYKEELGLRINDEFPFMSLFLVVEQHIRPMNTYRTDTVSCRLIDQNGYVKGRGLSYYQYNFHLTTLHLNAGDTLDIRVRHNMKREILPGIANIGMTISK